MVKVHLTPHTISTKTQTWSCSKSNLTFFATSEFFSVQPEIDMLCLVTELVRGMRLFPV